MNRMYTRDNTGEATGTETVIQQQLRLQLLQSDDCMSMGPPPFQLCVLLLSLSFVVGAGAHLRGGALPLAILTGDNSVREAPMSLEVVVNYFDHGGASVLVFLTGVRNFDSFRFTVREGVHGQYVPIRGAALGLGSKYFNTNTMSRDQAPGVVAGARSGHAPPLAGKAMRQLLTKISIAEQAPVGALCLTEVVFKMPTGPLHLPPTCENPLEVAAAKKKDFRRVSSRIPLRLWLPDHKPKTHKTHAVLAAKHTARATMTGDRAPIKHNRAKMHANLLSEFKTFMQGSKLAFITKHRVVSHAQDRQWEGLVRAPELASLAMDGAQGVAKLDSKEGNLLPPSTAVHEHSLYQQLQPAAISSSGGQTDWQVLNAPPNFAPDEDMPATVTPAQKSQWSQNLSPTDRINLAHRDRLEAKAGAKKVQWHQHLSPANRVNMAHRDRLKADAALKKAALAVAAATEAKMSEIAAGLDLHYGGGDDNDDGGLW